MAESNKTAVVTGASSGIGRETAKRLVGKGFKVIAAARRLDRMEELKSQFGNIVPMQVDLSRAEEVERFCGELSRLPEPVSILINNAGYSIRGALEDVSPDAVRRVFQVNVFSLIRVTQACLPGMRKARKGRVINLSSMAGKFAFPMSGVYAATKYAVEAVTDALRIEVRPFGIRVVAIRPGFTATEFNEVATRMTGDLLSRTDADYKPLYETSGATVGKMFVNATVPGPEVIADLIMEAVESDSPKAAYSGSFLSEEFLGRRAALDDDAFDTWLSEKTGLAGLKV
jgi:NADP-dependent 3-hydroxy acid dehydrogenase YdfG